MYVFFVLFISVYSCVYLAAAGSPQALCAPASVLLWLPGAPEDFFAGICWQINAAGLANCSFSGWHQPQRTLNTKRWTLFALSLFPTNVHTETIRHHSAKPRISDGPSLRKNPQIQPKIWIKILILNSGGSDLTRSRVWLLAITPLLIALSLSLSLAVSQSLPLSPFSRSLTLSLKFWTAVSHCEKGGK